MKCLACPCRERESAVEHWMESASVSSREADVAERETQKAREGAVRLEAEVKRLSTHLADLNSSYRLVLFGFACMFLTWGLVMRPYCPQTTCLISYGLIAAILNLFERCCSVTRKGGREEGRHTACMRYCSYLPGSATGPAASHH